MSPKIELLKDGGQDEDLLKKIKNLDKNQVCLVKC